MVMCIRQGCSGVFGGRSPGRSSAGAGTLFGLGIRSAAGARTFDPRLPALEVQGHDGARTALVAPDAGGRFQSLIGARAQVGVGAALREQAAREVEERAWIRALVRHRGPVGSV